ncbi:MAG TPA: hypothetical protein DFR83_03410 [Deltaproteobacteria bacterium]|nr:hypothetical protein [Deltaproteobacteria bacterium]
MPVSHGAQRVAQASFGTVIAVGAALFVAALITGQGFTVYLALLFGLGAAGFGYWLWDQGAYRIATTIHAGGLIQAGALTYVFTETLGGATAVLLLASVITAGGLLGWRGAVAAVACLALVIPAGHVWAEPARLLLGGEHEPILVSETMMTVFVLTSIPSWGAYVVAIDASNRAAWVQARAAADALERSNQELAEANRTLTEQRDRVQRAVEQQAAVARLGLYANGPASVDAVLERATQILERWCDVPDLIGVVHTSIREQAELLERLPVEDRPFARGVLQVVQMRSVRTETSADEQPEPTAASEYRAFASPTSLGRVDADV